MGRPPIGKHAMSGAERQRKYLDRLLGATEEVAALKREIERLKAQRAAKPPKPELPEQVATLQQKLVAAQTRNRNLNLENKAALEARERARTMLRDAERVLHYVGRQIRAAFHPAKDPAAAMQTVIRLCEQMESQIERLRIGI